MKENPMPNDIDEEYIPFKSERKLANLFRTEPLLNQNKELQDKIISLIKETLKEARDEWCDIRATTVDAIITCDRKAEAIKRGKARNKKYEPFREYFKRLQQKHFLEHEKIGKKMTANSFVAWFLENIPNEVIIPYKKSNQYHKLIRLAEENNREFRKKHP